MVVLSKVRLVVELLLIILPWILLLLLHVLIRIEAGVVGLLLLCLLLWEESLVVVLLVVLVIRLGRLLASLQLLIWLLVIDCLLRLFTKILLSLTRWLLVSGASALVPIVVTLIEILGVLFLLLICI